MIAHHGFSGAGQVSGVFAWSGKHCLSIGARILRSWGNPKRVYCRREWDTLIVSKDPYPGAIPCLVNAHRIVIPAIFRVGFEAKPIMRRWLLPNGEVTFREVRNG